jgi:hypothetical protein
LGTDVNGPSDIGMIGTGAEIAAEAIVVRGNVTVLALDLSRGHRKIQWNFVFSLLYNYPCRRVFLHPLVHRDYPPNSSCYRHGFKFHQCGIEQSLSTLPPAQCVSIASHVAVETVHLLFARSMQQK